MRRSGFSILFLFWLPTFAWSEAGIPAKGQEVLKGATVFVKVDGGRWQASGSGFLMKVEGKTGYVVTNHHVVAPPRGVNREPVVRLVFWSGTKKEKSVRAELVASDSLRD